MALGLGALMAASELAFTALKWAGAAYLFWLGLRLIGRPRTEFAVPPEASTAGKSSGWFWLGLLQNLLNPKVGIFYLSFLPQFVPPTVPFAPFAFLLATIHSALGLLWLTILVLAAHSLQRLLRRPKVIRTMDRLTGSLFIGFGVRLALSRY